MSQAVPAPLAPLPAAGRFTGRVHAGWTRVWPQAAFFALLVTGWQSMALWLHSPLVPGVGPIFRELVKTCADGFALVQIGITFGRMTAGFLLALLLALPIGIAAAVSRTAARFFEPGIILGLTVPGLVWALLCVIWFGVGLLSPMIAVALGVLPTLVITVQHAVRSLSFETVEMALVFRLRRGAVLRRIWLPLLYASIVAGCRVGFSLAWKVIVLVEIFGLSDGVGYQLNAQFSSQNVEGVMAWTLWFWLAMMLVENGLFRPLDRHANHWKRIAAHEQ